MGGAQETEIGYAIPARPGMAEAGIVTPCLVLDLGALERNLRRMADFVQAKGLKLRPHGKMHKSADVAALQMRIGGAVGLCCQKASEAEAFVRAGIPDILVSNEVRQPVMLDRLAALAAKGATIAVCVDDAAGVADLSAAALAAETELGCLVEIDCGAGRCGVPDAPSAVALAQAIWSAPGLRFEGIQAYQGTLQHLEKAEDRAAAFAKVERVVRSVLEALAAAGLPCPTVTGGGTGSYEMEAASGLYTELQCGSYAFMDADYGRVRSPDGRRLDDGTWENALFVLTSVMSTPAPGRAVCDAGLKSMTAESGLPFVHGRTDLTYTGISDEHGVIADPRRTLKVGDKLRLVPGHCDPTCNLHDWYVGLRGGIVECLWPVTARGKSF